MAAVQDIFTRILGGDCLDALKQVDDESVDLIITSPPYADRRAHTYGGIKPDVYVEWFLPRAEEFKRILKPTGSFVLNIKEQVNSGARTLYVYDLVSALAREQGWTWVDDYCWSKKNPVPGKWPNRFRDGWEHCYHFSKSKKASGFFMDQDAVRIPAGDWQQSRLKKLGENDKGRLEMATGSGFGRNVSNWVGRDLAYPSNVLHLAVVSHNTGHSAAFPKSLPEFFIKLFAPEHGVVCDPFVGSGTTSIVAHDLGRSSIGVELLTENLDLIKKRLQAAGVTKPQIIRPRKVRKRQAKGSGA